MSEHTEHFAGPQAMEIARRRHERRSHRTARSDIQGPEEAVLTTK
jgi:hypothetical protein